MIDEDRTMQLFGYTSDELSKGSSKKVVAVCEECGTYRVIRKAECYRALCRSCARKGENNPYWKGGKVTKVCEVCGNEFLVSPHKVDLARFCSRECKGKWQSENWSGENSPSWKEKVVKVCEICGKEFSVVPSHSNSRRCCSRECQCKWMSENRRGENGPSWKENVIKVCEVCGKEFSVLPYQSKQRFCSHDCSNKSEERRRRQSATRQGIPYDNWEGYAKNSLYCPEFNEGCRESNREKYDRRCFLSGMTEEENGQKLSVHHVDMNKQQGCDGHRWKLVPLSMKWHGRTHNKTWTARIGYLLNHVWANMEEAL